MWASIWKVDFRKASMFYAPCLTVACGYALLFPYRLYGSDAIMALIGAAQGALLAIGIFGDSPNTQPLLFSRPLSRGRQFFLRWSLGLTCQLASLLIVFGLLALGCREWVQTVQGEGVWYPMVKWYELSVLWPLGLASLLCYQAAMAGRLARMVLEQERASTSRAPRKLAQMTRSGRSILFAAGLGAVSCALLLVILPATVRMSNGRLFPASTLDCAIAYICVVTVLTTIAALHCFRRLEIEA